MINRLNEGTLVFERGLKMICCAFLTVEHQFEITVEDIRGLCVFGSTVWGETDCFVQYHFPFQRDLQHSDFSSDGKISISSLPSERPFTLWNGIIPVIFFLSDPNPSTTSHPYNTVCP